MDELLRRVMGTSSGFLLGAVYLLESGPLDLLILLSSRLALMLILSFNMERFMINNL